MGWSARRRGAAAIVLALAATALTLPAAALAGASGERIAPGVFLGAGAQIDDDDARPARSQRPRVPERERRVVGGSATSIESWPWQAGLTRSPTRYGGDAYQRQICGGSVVAPTIVITAAHCVYDSEAGGFVDPHDFGVVTGRTFLSSDEGQEIAVANFFVPVDAGGVPLYDEEASRWDVALLKLASSSDATPIAIAGPEESGLWEAGRTAFVTGWGQLGSTGGYPNGLQAAQVPIVADSACDSPGSWRGLFDLATMVCAGHLAGGADTCGGDSGGPLVVPAADGSFRLVGNTSFGGQECGAPGVVGVYGRLADDPMRTVLRNMVLALSGRDIVGAGAQPPESVGVSAELALSLSEAYAQKQCRRWNICRRSWAGSCAPAAGGYACEVRNLAVDRRGRKSHCRRTIQWSGIGGAVSRQALGRWRCQPGWPRAA